MHLSLQEETVIEIDSTTAWTKPIISHLLIIIYPNSNNYLQSFLVVLGILMGLSPSLQCCTPSPSDNEFRIQAPSSSPQLSHQQHQILRNNLRLINLVSALNFQVASLQSRKTEVTQISNEIKLISRFIEIIEYEADRAFLNILQSKTMFTDHSNKAEQAIEVCLLDISSLPYPPSLLDQEVKKCFQILQLLKLQYPLQNYLSQDLLSILIQEITSIPQSDSYLWDFYLRPSPQNMLPHIRYHLRKLLPFLNQYLSLNDPPSYLHIRHFYHFLRHKIFLPLCLPRSRYYMGLKAEAAQILLYREGNILITSNFMCFNCQQAWQKKAKNIIPKVLLWLEIDSDKEGGSKLFDRGRLWYIPFSMFAIRRVVSRGDSIEVSLSELQQQIILHELDIPLDRKRDQNHVIINQANLLTEIRSLCNVLSQKLQSNLEYLPDEASPEVFEAIQDYYQSYQVRLAQHLSCLRLENQPLRGAQEEPNEAVSQREEQLAQEAEEMEELPSQQILRCQKKILNYIKQQKLQKLFSQVCDVERFYYLKSLNLSQCWLQKIECLECFPNLTSLYLYSNQISAIEGLSRNRKLQLLSLSRNRISSLANIQHLTHLCYLYLTKNPLGRDSAQYLCSLTIKKLRQLSISFVEEPNKCFEVISQRLPYRVGSLVINGAQGLLERTKNMLRKRLKNTSIQFIKS